MILDRDYRQTQLQMKTLTSLIVGLRDCAGGYSTGELFSALTEDQHNGLVGFARYHLKSRDGTQGLKEWLKQIEPEEITNQALLKLALGETEPSLGRQLKT
jgi:hypothetical protein